jgi:glycosyltransferase involved in cell wall biosynthesis
LIKIDYIFAYLNSPNFNLLKSYYSSEKKIIQFKNGLNIELIRNIQFNSKYKFDIIYLGRIHEAKGIFDFLNTISELSKSFDNLKVAIAGSGDAFSNQKFHDYITQHNLGTVITFFGYVSTIDKYSLLKSSKIFMAPSYDESFPISTIEAYVCGCDIITYDLPTYHNPPYINFSLKLVDIGSIQSLISNATNLLKISSIKKNPDISFITTYEKNASEELNIFLDV